MLFKIIKCDVNEKVVCLTKLEKDCWFYLFIYTKYIVGLSRGPKNRGFISAPEIYHAVANDNN